MALVLRWVILFGVLSWLSGCIASLQPAVTVTKTDSKGLVSTRVIGKRKAAPKQVRYVSVRSNYKGSLVQRSHTTSTGQIESHSKRTQTGTLTVRKAIEGERDLRVLAAREYERGRYTKALDYYLRALQEDPKDGELQYDIGSVYLAQNSYKSAARHFAEALKYGFATKETYHNLGLAYLGLGKTGSAKKVWFKARKDGIKSAEIETSLGLGELDEGDTNKAIKYFSRALKYDPEYPEAHNGLGIVSLNKGDLNEAIVHWSNAEQAEQSQKGVSRSGFALEVFRSDLATNRSLGVILGPDIDKVPNQLDAGLTLAQTGQFREAVDLVRRSETAEQGNPYYWNLLGYLYALQDEYLKAEDAWEHAIDLGTTDDEVYVNLATLEFGKRNLLRADVLCNKALTLQSDSEVALTLKGDIAFASGERKKAASYYEKALKVQPNYVSALNNLALLRISDFRYPEAAELFEKAVIRSGGAQDVRYNYALSQIINGDLDEAEKELNRVRRSQPRNAGVYLHLGYVSGTKGRYDEAEKYFKQSAKLDPESAMALNNLGVVKQKTGKLKAAEEYYQEAVDLDPQFAEGFNNLGSVYIASRQNNQALFAYEKAVSLSRIDHESRRNLGQLYLLGHQPGQAVHHLQLALAMKPKDLDTLFFLALSYRELGKSAESATFFKSFLEFAEGDESRREQVLQAKRELLQLT